MFSFTALKSKTTNMLKRGTERKEQNYEYIERETATSEPAFSVSVHPSLSGNMKTCGRVQSILPNIQTYFVFFK